MNIVGSEYAFAGIDGGGTKARMLVTDAELRIVREVYAGTTNLSAAGEAVVESNLKDLFAQAGVKEYKAVALGTAGVIRAGSHELLTDMIARITGCNNITIIGDMTLPLYAQPPGTNAQILIAGTGSICYGKDTNNKTARSGGWGHLFGDEGGAYWIACRALDVCLRAFDGRAEATALTELMLEYYKVRTPPSLIAALYAEDFNKSKIARAAVNVSEAAQKGDFTAVAILRDAATQLVELSAAVSRALGPPDTLLFAGGVLVHDDIVRQAVINDLTARYPKTRVLPPGDALEQDAAWGAVLLAAETYKQKKD